MDDYDFGSISNDDDAFREAEKKQQKSDSGGKMVLIIVAIVIAVFVIGSIVVGGIVVLWASSFTEEFDSDIATMNVNGEIDPGTDELTMEVYSGTVEWSDYRVSADGIILTTSSTSSSAGDQATFSASGWDPEPGMMYTVTIADIDENKVVWENDIIAR